MVSSRSTGAFWDTENCKLPSQLNCATYIKLSTIYASLRRGGVRVDKLEVYAFGNAANISTKVRQEFEAGDIKLVDAPSGGGVKKNGADIKLINSMYSWSRDNPKGNILLIAADSDYVETLKYDSREVGYRSTADGPRTDMVELAGHSPFLVWQFSHMLPKRG